MSRPRFLADHDFNHKIVAGLRRREPALEFIRLIDLNLQEASDPSILDYAATQGLIVVSHDTNTMCGHAYDRIAQNLSMPGLFIAGQDEPIRLMIDEVLLIWSLTEAEDWAGKVTFLPIPASL